MIIQSTKVTIHLTTCHVGFLNNRQVSDASLAWLDDGFFAGASRG